MKYIYTLTLILVMSVNSYSQEYEPMLGDSNVCYVFSQSEGYYTEVYYIYKDTLFNDYKYKVVWNDPKPYSHNILGFIREDSINKKVFFNYGYYNKDFLWFDFSLSQGDSILLETMSDWDVVTLGYFKVDSIGDINTFHGKRRAIYLTSPPNDWGISEHPIWVEGIGTLGDLLIRHWPPGVNGELSCFYKDGELIYKSPLAIKYDTCLLFSSGTIETANNNLITIHPNPFIDQLTIEGLPDEQITIEIYDLFGKEIYRAVVNSVSSYSVTTGEINPGLYLIRIRSTDKGGVVTSKIIFKK